MDLDLTNNTYFKLKPLIEKMKVEVKKITPTGQMVLSGEDKMYTLPVSKAKRKNITMEALDQMVIVSFISKEGDNKGEMMNVVTIL